MHYLLTPSRLVTGGGWPPRGMLSSKIPHSERTSPVISHEPMTAEITVFT